MKLSSLLLLLTCCLLATSVSAQTTTAGSYLVNGRNYYVDRAITGQTEDAGGVNYVLLHEAYQGTGFADMHYVMGKISALRGSATAYNRNVTVEVNTSTAYSSDAGTCLSYGENAGLFYVTYAGKKYVAVGLGNGGSLFNLTFTGYAGGESLILVTDDVITNRVAFTGTYPISTMSKFGVGVLDPVTQFHVSGGGADINSYNTTTGDLLVQAATGGRNTTKGAQIEFGIPINTDGSGLWGQGRIVTVAGTTGVSSDATGKMILGTRRSFNKLGSSVQWYYGDDIVIDGTGNVGIGTLLPQSKLAVAGQITAQKVKVTMTGWSDYVFEKDYVLPSLQSLEAYVNANHHLPDVPAADKVIKEGLDVGEMNNILLKKMEEQTLYLIQLQKKIDALQQEVNALKKK